MHDGSMRSRILAAILAEIEPHPHIHAFWEQGSRAMGRADDLSDLDLNLLVSDGHVAEACAAVERALTKLAPWEHRFELPQPTWHGNWQAFYRLEGCPPHLLIDLCILEQSTPNRFLEPELHGRPVVYFDKIGWVRPEPADATSFAERIRKRLPVLESTTELFSPFVGKEVLRGRDLDALHFYMNMVVPRLVEALRARHAPWRFTFGMRYLGYDLPPTVYAEVKDLLFVDNAAELPARTERAVAIIRQTLAELRALDLVNLLEQTR